MDEMVDVFQVLGNKIRYKIVKTLVAKKRRDPKSEGMCVCHLVKLCKTANSTMTHHLDWLRSVGILTSEKRGQWIYYDINMKKLDEIKNTIQEEF